MKMELRRLIFEEQARSERRRGAGAVESHVTGSLKPWARGSDSSQGRGEWALINRPSSPPIWWQVHLGEGSEEYRDPAEFFRRTYLTESLKSLLTGAMQRLSGDGGDPVIQLQTNFGGGQDSFDAGALSSLFGHDAGRAAWCRRPDGGRRHREAALEY